MITVKPCYLNHWALFVLKNNHKYIGYKIFFWFDFIDKMS